MLQYAKNWRRWVSFCLLLISVSAIAGNQQWRASREVINLKTTLSQLSQKTALCIIFPAIIPAPDGQRLYASFSSYGVNPNFNSFWQINIDTSANCHGVRVCNIGNLSAEKNGKLNKQYVILPANTVHLKERIKLKDNTIAYYTPFHVQAGGVNPAIEWQVGDLLYRLSWRINADPSLQKQILIAMVNNAKKYSAFVTEQIVVHK